MGTWGKIFTACPGVWSPGDYQSLNHAKLQKSDPKNFGVWRKNIPDIVKNKIKTPCSDPRWGIIRHQTMRTNDKCDSRKYVICLDPKSDYAGNIYNGYSRGDIYGILFCSVLVRPFHLAGKWLYHVTLVGVARAVFNGIWENKPLKQVGERIVRNLVDIVRTPIYGTALLTLSIAALIVIPFSSTLAYDFRAAIGDLSHELYWGRRYKPPIDLTPCMRRLANIMDFELNKDKQFTDDAEIIYTDLSSPILVALDNGLRYK